MKQKIEEIQKTNKIKIYFHKDTKEFCGAGFLDGQKVNEKLTNKTSDIKKLECISSFLNKQHHHKKEVDKHFSAKEQDDILKEVEDKVDFIEVNFDEWCEFIKGSHDVIKVVNGVLVGEIIPLTLEQLKAQRINSREIYLRETAIKYGHDWTTALSEVIDKRTLANTEIEEIENATEETIEGYNVNFKD